MAENRNLHVQLNVDANTKKAQSELQQLSQTLSKLSVLPSIKVDDDQIKKASAAAKELQQHLSNAVNVNTGKLDLNKFTSSLNQSNKSLKDYKRDLEAIGPEGRQAFLQLSSSIASADAPLITANTHLQEFLGTLKNTARWQISSSILHGFMGAIQSAMGYAKDLNESLNNIQIVTQYSSNYMADFAQQANKAAKELHTSTTAYTDAALIYYQQGLKDSEVQKRAEITIKMANATGRAAQEVSSQLTAVWNNFADGSDNLEHYADVMAALGAKTASSSSEIADGLQKFASIGETVGLSYEYAASALATITATTRESADTVGNALKTLFARIQGLKLGETLEDGVDLNKYSKALAKVGVDVLDVNGELKDMDVILNELGPKWQTLGREQQTALAQTVAGVRQYAQFMTLMNNWDFFQENVNTSNNSDGYLEKQAEIYANSWKAARADVQASLQGIYDTLIDEDFFIGFDKGLAKVLDGVDGLLKGLGGFPGILATISSFITGALAKEAPAALEKITSSISLIAGSGQNSVVQTLSDLREATANMPKSDSLQYDTEIEKINVISNMKQQLAEKAETLSNAEKEAYENAIRTAEAQYDVAIAYGKAADEAAKKVENIKADIVAASDEKTHVNQQIETLERYIKTVEEMGIVKESVTQKANSWQSEGVEVDELKNKIRDYLDQLQEIESVDLSDEGWQKLLEDLDKTDITAEDLYADLKAIGNDNFRIKISDSEGNEATESLGDWKFLIGAIKEELQELGVTSPSLEKLDAAIKGNVKSTREYAESSKKAGESSKDLGDHTVKAAEQMAKIGSALMSITALLNSMKRLSDVFSDKDATTLEKITAAIGLFVTLTRTAKTVSEALSVTMGVQTAAHAANAVAEGAETAAATGLSIANGKLALSFGALQASIPIVGIVLAGVTAAITAAAAIIGKHKKAIEEEIEAEKKRAEQAKATHESVKAEVESNEALVQSYKDTLKTWQTTGTGRDALVAATKAVCEAYDIENGSLLLLTGQYDELTKAIYRKRDASLEDLKTSIREDKAYAEKDFVSGFSGSDNIETDYNGQYYHILNDGTRITQEVFDQQVENWEKVLETAEEGSKEYEEAVQKLNELWYSSTEYGQDTLLRFKDNVDGYDEYAEKTQEAVDKVIAANEDIKLSISDTTGSRGDLFLNLGEIDADNAAESYKIAYDQVLEIKKAIQEVYDEDMSYLDSGIWKSIEKFIQENEENYNRLKELEEEYQTVDLSDKMEDVTQSYIKKLGHDIESFDEYEKLIEELKETLKKAGVKDEDLDEMIKNYWSGYSTYADFATEAEAVKQKVEEATSDVWNSERIQSFYESLSPEQKEFFLYLDFDENVSEENLLEEVNHLKEVADREENKVLIQSQFSEAQDNFGYKSGMNFSELMNWKESSGIVWDTHITVTGREEAEDAIISWEEFISADEAKQQQMLHDYSSSISIVNSEDLDQQLTEANQVLEEKRKNLREKFEEYGIDLFPDFKPGEPFLIPKEIPALTDEQAAEIEAAKQEVTEAEEGVKTAEDNIVVNTAVTAAKIKSSIKELKDSQFKAGDIIDLDTFNALTQDEGLGLNLDNIVIKSENGQITVKDPDALNKKIKEALINQVISGDLDIPIQSLITSTKDLELIPPEWIKENNELYQIIVKNVNAQELWGTKIRDFNSVVKQAQNDGAKFSEVWEKAQNNIKSISAGEAISGFYKVLTEGGDAAEWLYQNLSKVKITGDESTGTLLTLKAAVEEAGGDWTVISNQIDLTGKSLEQLKNLSKDKIINDEQYDKAATALAKTTDSIDELREIFREGNVDADGFASNVERLFKAGDISLSQAIQEIWNQVDGVKFTSQDAHDAIDKLLNNNSVTSQERIEQLNKLISEGKANAKEYSEYIQALLGSEDLTSQQKLAELGKTTFDRSDKTHHNNYSAEDRYAGYSQLAQDESLSSDDRQKALEGMKRAMDELGESAIRTREYADAVMKVSQDAGDTAEETATKLFEAFGGANMDPDNWVTFGTMIKTVLDDMEGDAEAKMKFIQELLEGTGISIEQLQISLDNLGGLDLSGKSLAELRSKDEYKNDPGYDKAVEDALATETNLAAVRESLQAGQIDAEHYSQKVAELFNNDDITLEQALTSIDIAEKNNALDAEQAAKVIDELLNQSSMTTEERLKAINEKIEEGKASAEDYSEKLKLILEDDTKTDQTKLNELTSKDENGEYIYSAEDREAGLSSLLDSEALSYEQLAQVMEEVNIARQELNYSGDEAIIKTAQHAEEVQELSQKMGDSAEETAAKVAEAYGEENINSENLQSFGAQLKEIMSDSELTVEEKINYVKELLTSMGLTLDEVGLKIKDFGSFQLDTENFTIAENLERMNEALSNGLISDFDEYGQHLETLLKGELDWTMTTEQATAKLINFEVALAKSKGTLNDQAGSIARLCESTEDYEILVSALERNEASEEETNRTKQIALSEIAKKYDSCTQALSKYEAALRSGDKQQIDSAESALILSAKCAENAKQFSINATEVEALAKSYMNLNGTLDENGNKIEMSAEMASDLAARDINLNKGIADLQKNWESYSGALEQLQAYYDPLTESFTDAYSAIEGQGEALEGVRDAVADVLNVTDSASISNEFLAENADLVAAAMNGEQWAVEALQLKLAEGLQAEIGLDDSEFQAIAAEVGLECENLADWLQNLPEGQITANNLDFVQKLVDSMVQAGMAQEEIENKLSGLGITVDLEPFAEEMQEAVNIAEQGAQGIADVTEQGAQAVTDASQQGAQNMADNYAEGADNAAESAGLDAETESSKTVDEDVEEAVSFYGEASPVRSMGLIPKFTAMPIGNAGFTFPVFAGFDNISATYPGVTMSPDVVPETATKESTATALRVKSANKSSGGNISHKNISGGNKPVSSGGSRGGGGSRTPRSSRSSSPRASAPRVTKVDAPNVTPTTRNTFTPERHDQMSHTDNQYEEKYHERIDPRTLYESVDNYIKQDPKRTLAKIIEDKDEVYTNRKVFRHERYEKDKQIDEKEYETKDASMYKRMSEEIDQYHDINKVLENIGNKLDEIDQRKSRAFGKAHIDAINEERAALEEQLAAQNQYITQMANDRKKLQDEMKATGWEFADNGDVSNYVQKKTKDVLDFNSAMEKWVDDTNKSREDWNDQAQEIADSYNKTNRDITDEYNLNMDKATVKYNTGVEQLDKITNAANKQITADLNAANERLAREKDQALQKAIDQYNDTAIGAVLERNQEIVTNINNRENSLTNAENQHRSSWMGTEYQRRAELTSNEQQNDMTLSSLEQNLYSGQMATEAQRVAENEAAISSFNSSISGYTGSYQDSDAASAAKDHVSQAKSDLDNARKIIDNNAQNTQKLLENDYKNAEAAEQNRAKERQKQIENNAKNTLDQINNTYKIAEQQAEGQYKTDETISKNKLKAAITAADNVLAAQTQSAEEIFEEGSQLVQHNANVAFKRVSNTYDRGIEELQRVYDDEAWLADQLKQDRKEQLESWFDARNEQNDKDLEAAQKLTDLAKEQGEFAYEESSKMLDEYESLSSTMTEAMMEAQEIRNKLYDNAIEVIDYTLNLKVEISNQVMVALQALLDALGTSADLAADRIANLAQQMNQFEYQTKETRKGILELINSTGDVSSDVLNRFMQGTFSMDDLNKIFNVDEFTADKIESLKTYRDNLVELINEQRALKQQMFDNVNGAFSEYQEKLGLQIEKITNLTKVTETYKAIVGIVGKEVLDASGKLSETLAKSAFETQRDQTHTYKSILDEIDSNIADMKQKQSQFDTGSEMYKDFQTQIEQMESTRKSAQDNWLSSWQAEMQAATDYYSEAIDTITMHLEKSMAGLIGSLDLLSNEYDRQKQISEVYVEDYEKIYQLNKLNRDVQNALDDSDHIKNKQQLKKLQQEINAANEDGVKMSQYDLDVLRKKFELELAREELEESRNAKSQVRMMRDAEGNYGYVYTADANAVADAEQNYEDKLHELQVLNTDYIKQLEDNYLSLQQNVRDEIASLDISQFSSEAEYLAEVDRIQQAALELQERYGQQMDNATNNNRSLYENEWRAYSEMTGYKISADEEYLDKFEETTYSVLTGFQSMQEAKDQFTSSLAQAVTDAILAFQQTRDMQEIAMHDGNLSLEDGENGLSKFADRAIEETDKITSQTEEIADQAELMSENFQNAFEQIADSASVFAENYVSAIQPVIDSNLQLLDSIAKLIEHQANLADQSGDGSGSGGIASGTRSAGTTWDAFATAGGGTEVKSRIGEYLPFIGALLQYGSYESDYEGWGTGETRRENLKKVFGDGADQDINNWLSEHAAGDSGSYWLTIANNPAAYSLNAMKKLMGVSFDTGGYTGDWNSLEGKLALLHEKELVLNKEDTNNILEAVDMVRKITQMIDLNALSAGTFMSDILSAATINSSNNETLQQEVHITAEFPNATDREEIIAAFDNLTNLAMQYAGKQNF